MTKFILGAKSFVLTPRGNQEEVMTYVSEDKRKGVQFHAHPTRMFQWVILRKEQMSRAEIDNVILMFCEAGMRQHQFKGGYAEAIQQITV